MCEPGTLIVASTAAAAAGKGVSALNAAAGQRYASRIATRNAQLANEQARDAQAANRLEAQRLYRKAGQVAGQQNAAMAANGIDLGFGSALQVQGDTAMLVGEDATQLYRKGFEETRGFEIDALNQRAEAAGRKRAATAALVEGAFDVGSTILGGAKQYDQYKRN
jgi:hypothetical protein